MDDNPVSPAAGRTPTGPQSPDVDAAAGHDGAPPAKPDASTVFDARTVLNANTRVDANPVAVGAVGTAEPEAAADEDTPTATWSKITWDGDASADDTGASADDTGASADDTSASAVAAANVLDVEQPANAVTASRAPADTAPADQQADSALSEPVDQPADSEPGQPAEAEPSNAGPSSDAEQVTVVPGVPRYHNPDCILIRFMDDENVQRTTVADAETAGCTPCRACRPE